jgi:hypothetical protein
MKNERKKCSIPSISLATKEQFNLLQVYTYSPHALYRNIILHRPIVRNHFPVFCKIFPALYRNITLHRPTVRNYFPVFSKIFPMSKNVLNKS